MKFIKVIATTIATLLLLSNVAVAAALYYFHRADHQVIVVTGGSMEPTIHVGSAVILKKVPHDVPVGTVVTFRSPTTQALTTHRVVSKRTIQGDLFLQTKGDANPTADPDLASADGVLGSPIHTIPYAGRVITFMTSPAGRLACIGPTLLLIILSETALTIRRLRAPTPPPTARARYVPRHAHSPASTAATDPAAA